MRTRLLALVACFGAAGCLALDDFEDIRASTTASGGSVATSTGALPSGTTSTSAGAGCGDGVKSASEACDGTDFGGETCATFLARPDAGGALACAPPSAGTSGCTIDATGCAYCGDAQCNNNEGCGEGAQKCEADCGVCPGCNNGQLDPGEPCDGANLNGATCASATAHGEAQGNLKCNGSCGFDASECVFCGDGVKNNGEQCDGGDLGGATCAALTGHPEANGGVSCAGCVYQTSCVFCGDGGCNNGEQCGTCGDCQVGPTCYARCCDYTLLSLACPDGGGCVNWGKAACGGVASSVSHNGTYVVAGTGCKVKCNSFTTWHNVGAAEGFSVPTCGAADANAYCATHGGFDGHSVKSNLCP